MPQNKKKQTVFSQPRDRRSGARHKTKKADKEQEALALLCPENLPDLTHTFKNSIHPEPLGHSPANKRQRLEIDSQPVRYD